MKEKMSTRCAQFVYICDVSKTTSCQVCIRVYIAETVAGTNAQNERNKNTSVVISNTSDFIAACGS